MYTNEVLRRPLAYFTRQESVPECNNKFIRTAATTIVSVFPTLHQVARKEKTKKHKTLQNNKQQTYKYW